MKSIVKRFLCYPSVLPAGKESTVMIAPKDIQYFFREDREYELAVFGTNEDFSDWFQHNREWGHPYTVKNGCLCFTHNFYKEQEYAIRFREKGAPENRLSVYAVDEDLYQLRPLKGDLHCHTLYSDGKDGPCTTPACYREQGFDFFALTDHNRFYPSCLAKEMYQDIPLGLHIMTGEEIHAPGSTLHIVHAGGTQSVSNEYIHHREQFEADVDAIAETLTHIPEEYRRAVALAKWACQKSHEAGGLAIFAHPHWQPHRNNVSDAFCDLLFEQKCFDAFELMGGLTSRFNNTQLAMWQEQLRKGYALPAVGSSDSHNHDPYAAVPIFARRFTVVFAQDNTTEAILDAIRKGYSLACELSENSDQEVRFFGVSLRLVRFAHFIFNNYFNETLRLCFGEAILMRRYAEGEPVGDQLAMFCDTVKDFYLRFYGKTPYEGLPQERLDYLNHGLEIQRTVGPAAKGGVIDLLPDGRNKRYE